MSTPTYEQIAELKRRNPEAILLFAVGDDFQIHGQDAEKAAPILDLGLILAHGDHCVTCFPRSELESRLNQLVAAGCLAAVCEQVVDRDGQPIRRDKIERVVTEGRLVS